MPTLTETLHEQCRALISQRGMFTEDLLAALRLIAGRSDGMLSELMEAYGGLQNLLLTGLPFVQWDFSSGVFSTTGMTFTRAGSRSATVIDNEGIVWSCKANELRLSGLRRVENGIPKSEEFTPGASENLEWVAGNGGVLTPATVSGPFGGVGGTVTLGTSKALIRTASSGVVIAGAVYIFSAWVKKSDSGGADNVRLTTNNTLAWGTGISQRFPLTTSWQRITLTGVAITSGTALRCFIGRVDASDTDDALCAGNVDVWGVQIELAAPGQTTASEYVSTGVLSTPFHGFFADGVRYFSTDRSGNTIAEATRLGLLIEEATTNQIRNSSMVGVAAGSPGTLPTNWISTDGGLTRTVVGTGFENGQPYVDIRWNGTTAATSLDLRFDGNTAIVASPSQSWAAAARWKMVGGSAANVSTSKIVIRSRDGGGAIISDTVGTSAVPTSSEIAGVATATTPALTAFVQELLILDFASGVAVDITLRVYMPQLEQKAFPTSFVPTTTAAVSRAVEGPIINPASFLSAAGTFSLYADFIAENGLDQVLMSVYDAPGLTPNVRLRKPSSNVGYLAVRDGATKDTATVNTSTNGARTKVAAAVEPAGAVICLNGGALSPSSGAIVNLSNIDSVVIGNLSGMGAICAKANIRSLRYYPARLPDATLQSLTA